MLPIKKFENFIAEKQLFDKKDRILLAVSGGKDSVLMLHLFKLMGIDCGVAHVNFALREEESRRDEDFVRRLSSTLNLPFYVTKFDTKKYAQTNKISTQMAARDLRYSWFEQIRMEQNFDFIALAQHKNDVVETMLINLIRGTGLRGLHGILPKKNKLIRPLLFLTRAEINNIVGENELSYVEDSSNLSIDYTRNKLRLEVIPLLKKINPHLESTFIENAAHFAEAEYFLNFEVDKIRKEVVEETKDGLLFSLERIKRLNPISLLLFELLKPYDFSASVVEEILAALNGLSGKHFFSVSHRAIIDRKHLIVTSLQTGIVKTQPIYPDTETLQFGNYQLCFSYKIENGFEQDRCKAFTDAEKLVYPLQVRVWQAADKFIPLGMKNFKKLSDFFIDEKIALHVKERTPLIINGNGDIVWVVGMRQDNRYKVSASTKKVAIFEIK